MNKSPIPPMQTINDNWKDGNISHPEQNKTVSGWTGRFLVKCLYDYEKKAWMTPKGTMIKVLMWNEYIG